MGNVTKNIAKKKVLNLGGNKEECIVLKAIKNIIKNINCPLTKEERRLLNKLKNVIVSERVYNHYITHIKNNENDTYEIARKKLIRNIILSDWQPINKNRIERRLFNYGNLSILWDENLNEIVWLDNKVGRYSFYVDQDKKKWINKELRINTYKVSKVG